MTTMFQRMPLHTPVGKKPPTIRMLSAATKHKETLRIRAYVTLAAGDATALAAAFLIANLAYMQDLSSPHGLTLVFAALPIYLVLAIYKNAYSGTALENIRIGIMRATHALAWTAAAVLFLTYFLKVGNQFSRIIFTAGCIGSATLIAGLRLASGQLLLRMLGGTPFTTIVIRDGVDYPGQAFETILTPQEIGFDPETQNPYMYHLFATSIGSADRLLVACPQARYPLWSAVLKSLSLDGEILTDENNDLGILGIGRHGERQTLIISVEPLRLHQRFVKRLFDTGFAAVALILLAPILLAITIAIRLDTRGPIFFVQDRIGRDNRIFQMFKFRSMHTDLCDRDADQLTRRGDNRVTRVGAFIRKHSLDELPQLLNVLNGTMSIVGPRPHAISAKAGDLLYWDADIRYRFRHSIKPGLTGLAQIRGFRGATEEVQDLTNRLSADLEYVSRWSITGDIWIILQTFGVLRHDNAF